MRTRPSWLFTNSRPSGANSMSVPPFRPPTTLVTVKPGGSFALALCAGLSSVRRTAAIKRPAPSAISGDLPKVVLFIISFLEALWLQEQLCSQRHGGIGFGRAGARESGV